MSHEKNSVAPTSSTSQHSHSNTPASSLTSSTTVSDQPSPPQKSISRPTFGIPLAEQMIRDNMELPKVVEKCCKHIQERGLDIVGIYRLSGTTSKVQKLKTLFNHGS